MKGNSYNTALVKNAKTGALETICLDTGEVLTTLAIHEMDKYRFNFDMALLICQKIREGATLKAIADDPTLPDLTVIHYWRRNNATFDEEIRLARKDRAEYYADKVVELANDIDDKDDVPVARFKADQYKWAAEKGDPSSYGNKVEHTGSNVAPAIVVVTGIERPPIEVIDYEETGKEKEVPAIESAEQDGRAIPDSVGVQEVLPEVCEAREAQGAGGASVQSDSRDGESES